MNGFFQTARNFAAQCLAFGGLGLFAYSAHHVSQNGELPDLPDFAIPLIGGGGVEETAPVDVEVADHRQLVILDPGHGGSQPGTVAGGNLEKELNLDTAQRVAALLRKQDIRVEFTREDDRNLKLNERAVIANKRPAALFVSIHHNANRLSQPHGAEVHYTFPKPSSVARSQRLLFAVDDGEEFVDRRSETLAFEIQRELCAASGANDRGIKNGMLAMTRWVSAPAVLVECGFLSNPTESQKLSTSSYRDKVSKGIANGIVAYLKKRSDDVMLGVSFPDRQARSELAELRELE